MGTSGNPAKKAASKKKVSDVSAFKKRAQGTTLELPSGLTVMAKRVELRTFILQGSIPNPLMEVVDDALKKGQKAKIEDMVGVEGDNLDLDSIRDMYEMVNRVVVASLVEPQVHELPEDEADRDDDLLYTDEVDDEDKMFIFQWAVGGTSDLETFRREAGADLAAVAEIQSARAATK